VDAKHASAALSVLLHDVPAEVRRGVARDLLQALGRGYEESGRARPEWLAELAADEEEDPGPSGG